MYLPHLKKGLQPASVDTAVKFSEPAPSNARASSPYSFWNSAGSTPPSRLASLNGDKFPGGFGVTDLLAVDYWTLRARSSQLFETNLYARGLIRRLLTNEINTGLTPEAMPEEAILGFEPDELAEWSEDVENRFHIWATSANVCDWKRKYTFAQLQEIVRMESLICGDVLVVIRTPRDVRAPAIQIIDGSRVRTPLGGMERARPGNRIIEGVEVDRHGRHVAYWVNNPNDTIDDVLKTTRIPTYGERSGRRLSYLVCGTEKRENQTRGVPLLSLILQSLREMDRYRDSAQRKALVNSILAMFIKKTEDKISSLPIQGGAVTNTSVSKPDNDPERTFNISEMIPGIVAEELQQGEEPVGFHSQGTDLHFPEFEKAIISGIAWANNIPPEILQLAFSNNYSASQAAINEFKVYLNKVWSDFGSNFCTPVYIEWLLSEVLAGRLANDSPGLIESWRDKKEYAAFGAWTQVAWYGTVKISTDVLKQGRGSQILVREGWSTNARESRMLGGGKFTKNIQILRRENQMKADALRPILELEQEFGTDETRRAIESLSDNIVEFSQNEA